MGEHIKLLSKGVLMKHGKIPGGDLHEIREALDLPETPIFSHQTARTKGNEAIHW